jgi:hypothetical protein
MFLIVYIEAHNQLTDWVRSFDNFITTITISGGKRKVFLIFITTIGYINLRREERLSFPLLGICVPFAGFSCFLRTLISSKRKARAFFSGTTLASKFALLCC